MPTLPVSSFVAADGTLVSEHCEDQPTKEFGTQLKMSTVGVCDETNVTRQDKNVIWISL